MKKILLFVLSFSVMCFGLFGCDLKLDDGKLKVMTSFYTMYDLTAKIAGDKATVTNMVPNGTEPHDWEPLAKDIVNLNRANIFVYNGADLEHWTETVLPTLENDRLITVEASKGITLLKGHSHDEEEPDEHGHDPHVWLSPLNVKIMLANIRDAFISADEENAAYYEANYQTYAAECDKLHGEFTEALGGFEKRTIVVTHQAFGYLCHEYGLTQMPISGLSPDVEPAAARMAEVITFVNENGIKVIFFEELVSPAVAQTIASETGAQTAVLSPIEGLSDNQRANGDDYFSVMRLNLAAIVNALTLQNQPV